MNTSPSVAQNLCMDTLRLVGDVWTLAVIAQLAEGPQRFNQLQQAVQGLNAVTLITRLRRLEQAALLVRTTATQDKQAVSYALTNKGRLLLPVIESLRTLSVQLAADRHDIL